MATKGLPLGEFIEEVADELRGLREKPLTGDRPIMKFRECVVEAAVDITVEGKGGVKFWVVEAGGSSARKASHKVSIKFDAIDERPTS